LSALNEDKEAKFSDNREIIRMNVIDAINFANVKSKVIYDDHHKSMTFNTDDKIYLRLHHEYSLLEKENIKLSHQRSDSYVIKRKMKRVVYELKLSKNARIHFVISVAQLKSTKNESDFFDKSRSINSELIEINEDTSTKRSYEIERILKKRIRKYDKIAMKQYLIK
jgi:hypothetical protein